MMMITWDGRLKPDSLVELSRRPLMLRAENDRGVWFCSDPFEEALVFPGPRFGRSRTVYLLNMSQAVELTGLEELKDLNFDFCWITIRMPGDAQILPFWTLCGSPSWKDRDVGNSIAQEVAGLLKRFNRLSCVKDTGSRLAGGVVVIPDEKGEVVSFETVKVWKCIPFNPDLNFIVGEIKEMLK